MSYKKTYHKRKIIIVGTMLILVASILCIRLGFLMIKKSTYYQKLALDLHQRERSIKAERGVIYDRNGVVLAGNKAVCTISVIHSQIKEPEQVIKVLQEELGLEESYVRKRVEKVSAREKIKSNVEKEIADTIRAYKLDGVMIDEDYKRYYPYESLASKVLGFTGSDNQGIIGLEVKYDSYLSGSPGKILTLTDARGVEVPNAAETRQEPVAGNHLITSIDVNIQKYVEQAATKAMKSHSAKQVSIIIMNPQNGEIYAMVNVPEFNLNEPYTLIDSLKSQENGNNTQELLNQMWRNSSVNDTYEPGSTFKIITAAAGLEENVVKVTDTFSCPGFRIVEDRKIRCHKTVGHGQETFQQGIMNSCNPVFMDVGARVGKEAMYKNYKKLGLFEKTGIDVPGEAKSIMHKLDNIGAVELATMSFGQSFQITPLELLRAVSAVINGGTLITPHFGIEVQNKEGQLVETLSYPTKENAIRKETSELMKELLESVVSEGSGQNAKIEGFRIGGKTATSEKLPRRSGKYISSFLGFAPANDPKVIGLIMIDEPVGTYYGGTIAAPVMKEIFENILPYLGIQQEYIAVQEETTS
ncbi:MAG: peptidoglycan glycosyltransferase [Firmicutes bacterium]|uniref:Peptidoglycan glycosyltransferase n=1 Tax=Candidatus Scybalomonas excrementavium TaxID=2840943 RepID=A0A9D9HZL6_9FIRM|nr:peptidoglycan glycosyltransferase [Candidatus Scybalomonas excrementavium]